MIVRRFYKFNAVVKELTLDRDQFLALDFVSSPASEWLPYLFHVLP